MALVLVQHDISGVVVELDEIHLAHPVLGPHYKRVRVNANGKVYAWGAKDPDAEDESENIDAAEVEAETPATARTAKKAEK